MILLIDNYDSFTFNLYQRLAEQGAPVEVVRNDAHTAAELVQTAPSGVVLGPGPGAPEHSGVCPALLDHLPHDTPLLGVCLGHQVLVQHYGGELEFDPQPVHGRASSIEHDGSTLFEGLDNPFAAGRYHSIRAARERLPRELSLSAWTDEGWVMAVRHTTRPQWGVQFHPESIMTPAGNRLLANFVRQAEHAERAGRPG